MKEADPALTTVSSVFNRSRASSRRSVFAPIAVSRNTWSASAARNCFT